MNGLPKPIRRPQPANNASRQAPCHRPTTPTGRDDRSQRPNFRSLLGGMFLKEVDRPILERIADRTYAIHDTFLMKAIENSEGKIARIRILLLLRRESIQRLLSVADYSACKDDIIVSVLNKAIASIETVNANTEPKRPASRYEIQS